MDALKTSTREVFFLYRKLWQLDPILYWQIVKLPYRRILYRGLFNLYRFKNFWGRDDYNVEHIIRTQELRKIGCHHFGTLHGQPAEPPILPQLRYILFDTYYIFGTDWHKRYNTATWPTEMKVKAVGSFALTRQKLKQLQYPRPDDIASFIKESFQSAETLKAIIHVAKAFPDKQVYLKPKGVPQGQFKKLIDEHLSFGPNNIIQTQEDSYEILLKTNFCLSDPSTLVAEAAQFGLASYCLAFSSEWKSLYWRRFPGLCPESAEEIISNIKAISNGTARYPIERYCDLINLTGEIIWDTVLTDMGLKNVGTGPNKHLQFVHALP